MEKKAIVYVEKSIDRALDIIREYKGIVLANYGQSILVRIDDAGLQALQAEEYMIRELADKRIVKMGGFELNTDLPQSRSTSALAAEMSLPSGRSHHILRLAGPMHIDWKRRLDALGVIIYQSIEEDHHLISVDSDRIDDLLALDFIESVSPYYAGLKVSNQLLNAELQDRLTATEAMKAVTPQGSEELKHMEAAPDIRSFTTVKAVPSDIEKVGNVEIILFDAADIVSVIDAIRTLGARVIRTSGEVIIAYTDLKNVPQIAAITQVRELNPYHEPELCNNVATGIIRANILHNNHELDGAGQIIGVADTGLDTGVDDATMLADFRGRIVSIYALGRPGDASDIHNHGTHVTGSVLGDGANSNGRIRGMAPAASVVFQSTMDANRGLGGLPADLGAGLFDVARDDGARIHTNSWSTTDSDGAYRVNASQADTFAFNNREFLILFAASNDAPLRVASPGTAKNVLTVGASESERLLPNTVNFPGSPMFPGGATWPDFDQQANDQDDVANFSSPGPTQSNRRKPDVVAPGTFILSTRSSVSVADTGPDGLDDTGDEDGIFTHAEAVGMGLPGQPLLGGGDQNAPDAPAGSGPDVTASYYYSNGTSMSTPITTGACALVRQYLIQQRNHIPSAALLKAIIINGAIDMGMGIPDNRQGWGRIELNNSLFPTITHRVQFDDNLDSAVTTGEIRTYEVFVSSTEEPLAVTLVWRDPAGNTIQNRLHLRVIHVDSGTSSTADDIMNILNNVQKVVIDPPQVGRYRIEVEGVNINTGVPELTGLRQDYALVVTNAMGFSCNPSDIVQVIDRSGSMGFSGYMTPAKERAKQMVDILQINDKAGLVSFHASADEVLPLTQINSQGDKDNIHTIIDTVTSSGMTDLREALEQGMTTLGPDTGRPRSIVFLSDGRHTVLTPAIDNPLLDSIAAGNVKVYTIALGPASDMPVLDNIANRTGTGSVYTVESAADLHKLHEIYYNILGDIGCGGVVHLSSDSVDLENGLEQAVAVDASVHEAHFAVSWEQAGALLDFCLEDPSGKVYNSGSTGVFYYSGSTHQFYRVTNPKKGIWQMILKVKEMSNNQSLYVTTAALTDSEVTCDVKINPNYLYHGKLMLMLRVAQGNRPLIGGNAIARITYPTKTIKTLLEKYVRELKEIKVNKKKLAGDEVDENLIKLGILAAQYGEKGKDIFERKTMDIKLNDDGIEGDPRSNDGIYTAFTSISNAKIAGPFQIQTLFEVKDEKIGTYLCTKLIPEYTGSFFDWWKDYLISYFYYNFRVGTPDPNFDYKADLSWWKDRLVNYFYEDMRIN